MSLHKNRVPGTSRILYLDGWRGIAILLVLLGHQLLAFSLSRLGVELFFVLSGRLMAEVLFEKITPFPRFFRHRISRIYPGLCLYVLTVWLLHDPAMSRLALLSCLTMTTNYLLAAHGHIPLIDHIWSLCVEEHMYLLLALMAFLHRHYRLQVLPALLLIAAECLLNGCYQTYYLHHSYYIVYLRSDVRGASVLLGAAAYLARERFHALSPALPPLLLISGITIQQLPVSDPLKYSLGTGLLAIGLATLPQCPARLKAVLSHPVLAFCGVISYSVYLWQQPYFSGHYYRYVLSLGLMSGIASYYLIEKPARMAINRRGEMGHGQH